MCSGYPLFFTDVIPIFQFAKWKKSAFGSHVYTFVWPNQIMWFTLCLNWLTQISVWIWWKQGIPEIGFPRKCQKSSHGSPLLHVIQFLVLHTDILIIHWSFWIYEYKMKTNQNTIIFGKHVILIPYRREHVPR